MSAVRDLFTRYLLQTNLEPIPADFDVLLLHFLLCLRSDVVRDRVCDVSNSAYGANDDEEDEQADKILEFGHDFGAGRVAGRVAEAKT